jgi:sulfate transport system ATP-binding protein
VVTSMRRLAGARIIELDIGAAGDKQQLIEIEVPLEAQVARGNAVKFRPSRWKVFAA